MAPRRAARPQRPYMPPPVRPSSTRSYLLQGVLLLLGLGLIVRLVFLQILHTHFLTAQGAARTVRIVTTPSYRGQILDRRGTPLAISAPRYRLALDPKRFEATPAQIHLLAKALKTPPHTLQIRIQKAQDRRFLALAHDLHPDLAAQIRKAQIPGVLLERTFQRYYPSGPECGQVIGFTDREDQGQSGLEFAYNTRLRAIPGKKRLLEDARGRWIDDLAELQTARSGQDLTLSIDLRIQSLALRTLKNALQQYHAKSAILVMVYIPTGEILAMVNAPAYNPNNRTERITSAARNRAVTDQFEPGSTAKPFTVLMGLESGAFSPDTPIQTSPGFFFVRTRKVQDLRDYGTLSLTEVLVKSSNVALGKIAMTLDPTTFTQGLTRFGFGSPLDLGFPGESSGRLNVRTASDVFSKITMSFGYGLAVTPLHLAAAYATLGARGIRHPLSLLKLPAGHVPEGIPVVSPEMADSLLQILHQVVPARGKLQGYTSAGKTGTTRVLDRTGYQADRHIALFAGVAPLENPQIATVVILEEPEEHQGHYYGSYCAAPVYAEIVQRALQLLQIPPQQPGGTR